MSSSLKLESNASVVQPFIREVLLSGIEIMVVMMRNVFLVSKETVVLRRWERSKQKFGFIKRVDKG